MSGAYRQRTVYAEFAEITNAQLRWAHVQFLKIQAQQGIAHKWKQLSYALKWEYKMHLPISPEVLRNRMYSYWVCGKDGRNCVVKIL